MLSRHITSVSTLADLKKFKGFNQNPVLLLGKDVVGDGFAAHYYWDDSSTDSVDTIYLNVVAVDGVTTGRWKKVIARVVTIPQGRLIYNGGKKELYVDTVTAANGTATINLTLDNTTNGTPIFSQIWWDDSKANIDTMTVADAVSSTKKSLTNGNRQLTHLFYRGQAPVISVVGVSVVNQAQRPAAGNTPVTFMVCGI